MSDGRAVRGVIAAVSKEGVIGLGGKIPWRHPGDLLRFKRVTLGSCVVMGRVTFESLGGRALRGRRNVVITRSPIEGVDCHYSLEAALRVIPDHSPVWFIGGAKIYEEAMRFADVLDVTYVPDLIQDPEAVRFPPIDGSEFIAGPLMAHEEERELSRRMYIRRVSHRNRAITGWETRS